MTRMIGLLIATLLACGDDASSTTPNERAFGPSNIDVGSCVPVSSRLLTDSDIIVEFEPKDGLIPLNQLFDLVVTVSDTPPENSVMIFVDATMPAHGHGMNTEPTVEPTGVHGQFLVSNMNLHMPGEWSLSILVMHGDIAEQVRTNVQCSEGA